MDASCSPKVKRLPVDPDRIRAAQAAAQAALERARSTLLQKRTSSAALFHRKVEEDRSSTRRRIDLSESRVVDSSSTPAMEWWDATLPSELDSLIPAPVHVNSKTGNAVEAGRLTPKERAKLKKLQRRAEVEEMQRKIKAGEIPPPPNKTKLKNLARILGTAADPSQSEIAVRQNIAQRILDNESKSKVKKTEIKKEPEISTTAVYSIDVGEISERQRFKITKNAQQLHLAGVAVKTRDRKFLIVVQGVNKSLRKFHALVARRIDWGVAVDAAMKPEDDEEQDEVASDSEKTNSLVQKIWTGPVNPKEQFWKFRWVEAGNEDEARRAAGKFWSFAERRK